MSMLDTMEQDIARINVAAGRIIDERDALKAIVRRMVDTETNEQGTTIGGQLRQIAEIIRDAKELLA